MSMLLEVVSGEMKGKSFQVTQPVVKVGAESGSDLLLPERQVSREHAEFRRIGDAWYVIDLGSLNGVAVNGERIRTKTEVFEGDRVTFGPVEVVVHGIRRGQTLPMPTGVHESADGGAGRFLVGTGAQNGVRFALRKDRVTIGRDADNDLVVTEPTISAKHAVLECRDRKSVLTDLGSTNGTFVNGAKIGTAELRPGDRIRFDQSEYLFEESVPAAPTVAPRDARGESRTLPRVAGGPVASPTARGNGGVVPAAGRVEPTLPAAPRNEPRRTGNWLQLTALVAILLAAVAAGLWVRDRLHRSSASASSSVASPSGQVPEVTPPVIPAATPTPESAQKIDRLLLRTSKGTELAGGARGAGTLSDLDGDGSADVVAASMGGTVLALSGRGGREIFRQSIGASVTSSPVLADLDRDGVNEAVVTTKEGDAVAVHRSGRVLWSSNLETDRQPIEGTAAMADYTGDGIPDAVVCDVRGTVTILGGERGWRIRRNGSLKGPFHAGPVLIPTGAAGGPNIVVAGASGMVYLLDGQSLEDRWQRDVSCPIETTPLVHDFNHDGTLDVLVAGTDAAGTMVALDGRNLQELRRYRAGTPVTATPLVAELGLTSPVLICGTRDGVRAIDLESGAPVWTHESPSARPVAAAPALYDLDADGHQDLILGLPSRGLVVLNGMTGKEIGSYATVADVTSRPSVGDLDGDGNLDLVVTDESGRLTVVTTNRHVASNTIVS